jgi:hypothetical protein
MENRKEWVREKIDATIKDFYKNTFKSQYYRKQLKWYEDVHELEPWWDLRIIIQVKIKENICYFINIWTHSALNLKWNKKAKINPVT